MIVVRNTAPLPTLPGTVDMVPSAQVEIIANGLAYQPRPTVQEYTTYSSRLIALNRAFFEGDRAPDHLLFQPGSIDSRHPASAEGPLWPLLMARYEPVEVVRDYLLLKRRERPLEQLIGKISAAQGSFRENISIPQPGQPMFVTIDVRPNLLGRLASLVYKPPQLSLELTFQNGAQARYRFIPNIGREGMVLAPTIDSAFGFGLLASGIADASAGDWPVAIRVTGAGAYRWFYEPTIRFGFSPLNLVPLRQAGAGSRFVAEVIEKVEDLRMAKSRLRSNPPWLMSAAEGIYAHAPSAIIVTTDGAARLRLAFGIRQGAYQGQGQSDGVCFSVRVPGGTTALFERCLDPKGTPADQGVISATVDLPPDTPEVIAETTCRTVCDWDWSFWSRLRPEPSLSR
jgi:hypothetical protein